MVDTTVTYNILLCCDGRIEKQRCWVCGLSVGFLQGSPGFGIPGQQGPKGENGERVSASLPVCVIGQMVV